jgi:hypothetical protein
MGRTIEVEGCEHCPAYEIAHREDAPAFCAITSRDVIDRSKGQRMAECPLDTEGPITIRARRTPGEVAHAECYAAIDGALLYSVDGVLLPWKDQEATCREAWEHVAAAVIADHKERQGDG